MLFYVLRQIIQQNRKDTRNDQKVQQRKTQVGNRGNGTASFEKADL